jgi:hypothetical protein
LKKLKEWFRIINIRVPYVGTADFSLGPMFVGIFVCSVIM